MEKKYIAIDLKSFYASVECAERKLDPLDTYLVVADESRTDKTICLAVSPALKAHGIPGRPRLFEVKSKVKAINTQRLRAAPGHAFRAETQSSLSLHFDPSLSLDFIIAKPRMSLYMAYSAKIFNIYQSFVSPKDIHVYSVDEVFIDVTAYLSAYKMSAHELAMKMIHEVLRQTGITATAGIGENLYLCKVAMDIVAKHIPPDSDGVRISEITMQDYRKLLWEHTPLTDFWRVGRGTAQKLEKNGLFTMGDIARCSLGRQDQKYNEDFLFSLFGKNAELLIDHAWGYEPCTIEAIRNYRPESTSSGAGQVLSMPYSFDKARVIVREMAGELALSLVRKHQVADQLVLTVCYEPSRAKDYESETTVDRYGRRTPKEAHGSQMLGAMTSSARKMTDAALSIYDKTVNPELEVRRIYLNVNHVLSENEASHIEHVEQLDMFTDYDQKKQEESQEKERLDKEKRAQEAVVRIREKFGKNAVLRLTSLQEGATAKDRNEQIGGHKA